MLGLKQPCHKKHSPEKVGQQLAKDHGVNSVLKSSVWVSYNRMDLCDPCLFGNFSRNYAKIQPSFK